MGKKANLSIASGYEKATLAAYGEHKLVEGETSPTGVEYISVYGNADSVINYDSAADPNHGDASFTNVKVSETGTKLSHMKNIYVVSGEVLASIV